jgi:hypothetical protein
MTTQLREGIVKKRQSPNSGVKEHVMHCMSLPGIKGILKRSGNKGDRDDGIGSEAPGGAVHWPPKNHRFWE